MKNSEYKDAKITVAPYRVTWESVPLSRREQQALKRANIKRAREDLQAAMSAPLETHRDQEVRVYPGDPRYDHGLVVCFQWLNVPRFKVQVPETK
jgi:hypothetical protein